MSWIRSWTERRVATNGIELNVLECGSGFPIVLAHGFPELAFSWRHQIRPLADAGYRVLAPDQRGYGRSSRPSAIEAYDIEQLGDDLLGLLDDVGAERGVFVGHDWGAVVVWALAQRAPERVAAVVGMSVPFLPRGPALPIASMREVMGERFFYVLYFQEPGVADCDLGRAPATTLRRMYTSQVSGAASFPAPRATSGFVDRLREPDEMPDWLGKLDFEYYVRAFSETGFTGALNWYRNIDRNWRLSERFAETPIEMPSLFIAGRQDPVAMMTPLTAMDGWVRDHRGNFFIEEAGHCVQQQKPEQVNEVLLRFLASLSLHQATESRSEDSQLNT